MLEAAISSRTGLNVHKCSGYGGSRGALKSPVVEMNALDAGCRPRRRRRQGEMLKGAM